MTEQATHMTITLDWGVGNVVVDFDASDLDNPDLQIDMSATSSVDGVAALEIALHAFAAASLMLNSGDLVPKGWEK